MSENKSVSVEKGNKLIAFFDGAENSEIEILGDMCPAIKYKNSYYPPDGDRLPQFDKDWNLLMPVCKKFSELRANGDKVAKEHEWTFYNKDMLYSLMQFDVSLTFEKLVEAIEWYNQIKQS